MIRSYYQKSKKLLYGLALFTGLLHGREVSAQQNSCYAEQATLVTPMASIIGPNASCAQQSAIFTNYFSKHASFHPGNPATTVSTRKKEIRIRAIVVTNTAYSRPNFTISDTATIRAIFETWPNEVPNGSLSSLKATNKPQSAVCGSCFVSDAKLRIKLTDIQFVTTNQLFTVNSSGYAWETVSIPFHLQQYGNQSDSILNVFIVNYGYEKPVLNPFQGGQASLGGRYTLTNDNTLGVMAYNYFTTDHWSAYSNFVHELGHNFGLWHLYGGECGPIEDRLVDIFPPGECNFPDNSLDFSTFDPTNPNNTHTYNFMDFRPGGYFSPIQLSRMHRSAYLGDISSYIYPTEDPGVSPWIISSNQTWDFGIRMYQDIIVKAGNTLTIKCVVEMPKFGRITVERGAKLILDGGTITSYHEKVGWHGIQLYGNNSLQPYPANQGSFEMKNNATIEYAYDGVIDFLDGVGQGGGIINVTNSTFKDCRRAVGLNDYPSFPRGTSCSFSNVKFLTTNPRAETNTNLNDFPMVSSYNERGVLITGCTFKNSIPMNTPLFDLSMRNRAIGSADAGFRIQNSSFSGYKDAINIGNYSNTPARGVKVMNCTFDSVNTGITFADNFSFAQGNTFDRLLNYVYTGGTIPTLYEGQAIYANTTGGLTITTNTILNSDNNQNTRGITVNNSAGSGGRVIDNSLTNIRLGIITQQNNPALDLLCNRFRDVAYGFVINPQSTGGILKNQGNGCSNTQYRAGNTFAGTSTSRLTSYLTTPWSYIYWGAIPSHNPTPVAGTGTVYVSTCLVVGSDPNPQCNLAGNVESVFDRLADEAFYSWAPPVVGPLQLRVAAEFASIIDHFNETENTTDMIRFLEGVNHIESQKLLLPLYLEQGNYSAFDKMLYNLQLPAEETAVYQEYYSLLKTLKKEGRSIHKLNAEELDLVRKIAAGTSEISARAKSLLDFAYHEKWYHVQEQLPATGATPGLANTNFKSILSDAVPNPAQKYALVEVVVEQGEAVMAALSVRNMMGQLVRTYPITKAGRQIIRIELDGLPEGVYIYSLQIGGKIQQSKRLVIVQ
ncbi:zinc-dependent metalloprotease [Edaphocola aurantiacus]|uniref:zinc-dependent metalloprotease n=1 Tax=Edaphocola aurantiacus TaxID=2601682 RepID=UPI001C97D9EF|nr:zinc-dependent metalloprotease [Edaphocola aurantiacus]